MSIEEINNLDNGDEVYWTDPTGENSRYIVIQYIEVYSHTGVGNIARIRAKDGTTLECFAEELS